MPAAIAIKTDQSSSRSPKNEGTMITTICLLAVATSAFSYEIPFRGLSSICKSAADCHVENSNCSKQGLCECRSGYIRDGSLTRCLKVANGYYDTCEESVQCSAFLDAGGTCDRPNEQCVCTENYHYLHGRCFETKGLDEPCDRDEECFVNADYQAASCRDGKCKCSEGFYQREYTTCRPAAKNIGDECALDSDCAFIENAICTSNVCTLDNGSPRVDSQDGGGEAMVATHRTREDDAELPFVARVRLSGGIVVGESQCKADLDCKLLDHSVCAANNTCVCDRGYFAIRDQTARGGPVDGCVPEIGTSCSAEQAKSNFSVGFSTCKNGAWTCDIDRAALKDNRLCRKFAKTIGAKCIHPEVCYLFGPRAKCADGKCTCDEASHWVAKEKFCWKYSKIKQGCKNDYECYSRGDDYIPKCTSGICTCPKGSVASDDGGYCYSSKPVFGSYCEKTEECKAIPNASCENNKCACSKTFFQREQQCVKGLNAACENDDECKLENTACLTVDNAKTCRCTSDFTVGSGNECIKKSHYKEACTEDVQCSAAVENTFCNATASRDYDGNNDEDASGRCDCIGDHYFNTEACYRKRKLGQDCKSERECFTTSSTGVCKNSVCSCDVDFVQVGEDCRSKNSSAGLLFDTRLLLAIVAIVTAIS
ncbi:cell death abnormality protein 1-like isoform X2 [Phymastichus coffea]|uniref:cell death abnormality protein 1-like isoform X2 n=1 Tax=Phymastichus coffea TaxID=108790 RepID=UPI00273BFE20|nr:cell death abnormality protein 1-like isoform X2 [Phymastichus coffea]